MKRFAALGLFVVVMIVPFLPHLEGEALFAGWLAVLFGGIGFVLGQEGKE